MAGGNGNHRRGKGEVTRLAVEGQRARDLRKEFNYVLQLNSTDDAVLARHENSLAQGAAQFAQSYYDFLFDNPATADVLYAFERKGGNIGDLIRSQLQHLVSLLSADHDSRAAHAGNLHSDNGIKPMWVMGAYRLYLNHLQQLIDTLPDLEEGESRRLEEAVIKRIFLDMGMMLQSYWDKLEQGMISARQDSEHDRNQIEELLGNIPQILWSVDVRSQSILYASPAAEQLCQSNNPKAPIPCLDHVHADDRERLSSAWQQALDGEQPRVEIRVETPQDGERWFRVQLFPCHVRRKVVRIDGLMEDVTTQRETLQQLEHMATTDELTELANRTLWYDRVNQAISQNQRNDNGKAVLMLLDLDHFKMINDTLGHPAGDDLLCQVAVRLKGALRDSDTLARLGGDEFAVLMPSVDDPKRAGEKVARKILDCFKAPYWFEGEELFFSTSIGIAIFPDHGSDADTLLSRADIAMYRSKRSDHGFLFYERGDDDGNAKHLQVSGQLRHALERNEFELHYQPKVDMRTHSISGAEALLRWKHPDEGLVQPGRFLHIAEQMGLMSPITNWVLVTALRQCQEWKQAGIHMPVAVNVSARSFQTPRFLERINWALSEAGVDGDCLEIEITEDTLMADLDHGAQMLARLNDLGVRVAVDDFGTGYSSLSYLKRLPIDKLKIDRSFLHDMADNENDAVIVRSIIDLGHNLGFSVTAEGVENANAWDVLETLGCDEVQGYHVGTPMEQRAFNSWMATGDWQARQH